MIDVKGAIAWWKSRGQKDRDGRNSDTDSLVQYNWSLKLGAGLTAFSCSKVRAALKNSGSCDLRTTMHSRISSLPVREAEALGVDPDSRSLRLII